MVIPPPTLPPVFVCLEQHLHSVTTVTHVQEEGGGVQICREDSVITRLCSQWLVEGRRADELTESKKTPGTPGKLMGDV